MIDNCFDNLVKESEKTHAAAMHRYNQFEDRIYYAGSMEQEKLAEILNSEYLPIVNNLNEEARGLMTKAINFIEKFDQQQMDVLNNFGAFYLRIGTSNDEYRRKLQLNKHNYEIEKANWADKNDERIEQLNAEFQELKTELSQALHHPKLDSCLEVCFKKLDELEGEYRSFHEGNVGIVKKHPEAITKQHKEFEVSVHSFFELVGPERKGELEFKRNEEVMRRARLQLSKEEYLKKVEEEKQAEENKNKKGGKPQAGKKDPKKAA